MSVNFRKPAFVVTICVLVFISACFLFISSITGRATAAQSEFPVPVSVNALMVTLIDHSAHYIWDYGYIERDITDEEWQVVEYYSIQLAAAGPLITLGGAGSLDDTWSTSDEWIAISRDMSNASILALDAATYKNKEMLLSAGNAILDTCLSCHESFKPSLPTEGILHQPSYDHLYHLLKDE